VVECDLAKVEVAGSNPVSRSRCFQVYMGGSMSPRPSSVFSVLLTLTITLSACGDRRALQSVSVSPATANSKTQFTATGVYNKTPTKVDITSTATWCVGSNSGLCAGNIATEANVNAGLAQCSPGFTGIVTIVAGQAGPSAGPDLGFPLKPFGVAQLNCP
jgi:hypothetical protein